MYKLVRNLMEKDEESEEVENLWLGIFVARNLCLKVFFVARNLCLKVFLVARNLCLFFCGLELVRVFLWLGTCA